MTRCEDDNPRQQNDDRCNDTATRRQENNVAERCNMYHSRTITAGNKNKATNDATRVHWNETTKKVTMHQYNVETARPMMENEKTRTREN